MGALKLDARVDTDLGLVRAFIEWRFDQGFLSSGAVLRKGWVEVGGFQAGRYQSYFDLYADEFNNIGVVGSDNRPVGAAYTATFDKWSAAVSLEDNSGAIGFPNYYGIQTAVGPGGLTSYAYPSPFVANPAVSGTPYYTAGGYRVPDVVTRLAYTDSWGQVQLNGAVHQVRASIFDEASGTTASGVAGIVPGFMADHTAYGWAVKAGAKVNLPMLGPGDTLYAEAAYTHGAMLYIGATGAYGLGRALELTYAADALPVGPGGSLKLTDGWNALAAYSHTWTPTVSTAFWASYSAVNYPGGTITGTTDYYAPGVGLQGRDFSYWQLGAQANWSPVRNLTFSGSVNWIALEAKRLAADALVYPGGNLTRNSNAAAFALRVERSF